MKTKTRIGRIRTGELSDAEAERAAALMPPIGRFWASARIQDEPPMACAVYCTTPGEALARIREVVAIWAEDD